jgi:hypothetical protein
MGNKRFTKGHSDRRRNDLVKTSRLDIEEILELVKKTAIEITFSDAIIMGDVYIGTGERLSLY